MASVTRLQHTSIPIPPGDHDRARAFFVGVLGLREVTPPSSLDHSLVIWFTFGDGACEVHCFTDPDISRMSNQQHLCLQVDDLEGFRSQLERAGVVIEETIPIVNRPRFFIRDPFNNQIEITEVTGAYT